MTGKAVGGTNGGLKLTYEQIPGSDVLRVVCAGTLSLRGRPAGSDPLIELLGPRVYGYNLILSLSPVAAAETTGLMWLYAVGEKAAAAGGKVVATGLSPMITAPLTILQVEMPFPVAASDHEAVAILAAK